MYSIESPWYRNCFVNELYSIYIELISHKTDVPWDIMWFEQMQFVKWFDPQVYAVQYGEKLLSSFF